ncbi:MAG: prephenate dehydratase [Planctomycetota bacterium]
MSENHWRVTSGEPGAYSEEAVAAMFGRAASSLPCPQFGDVFAALRRGAANAAAVPIENSTAGSVTEVYDALADHEEMIEGIIVGETVLAVRHCLLVLPGVTMNDLRRVASHPQALAQCRRFLGTHGLEPVAASDTAGAARELSCTRDPATGVLASGRAAERYRLAILRESVQDDARNATRFLALATRPPAGVVGDKTSFLLELRHVPGAMATCLEPLAEQGVNVTKIESRPIPDRPWHYRFFLDVEHPPDAPLARQIIASVTRQCLWHRHLGTYPSARRMTTLGNPASLPGARS